MNPQTISAENETRFNVISRALDNYKHIQEKLDNIEQLNSAINDEYLVDLIEHSSEVNSNIGDHKFFRGQEYQELLNESTNLDSIVNIPTKLDQCVCDPNRFNEAMDSLEIVDNLHRKYGHQITIVELLYKYSEKQRNILIANLCDRLEHLEDSSQNEAMSIVRLLIRCGKFSDRDLRLKYLQARDTWFNNACEEKSASFDDVVSVHCHGLPLIFNEYKSIFSKSICEVYDKRLMRHSTADSAKEDGAIVNSWLLLKTSMFIASLDVYLKTINQSGVQTPTMISDTIQKCFELTNWLASIGFDFSSQLRPLFSKAIIEEVKTSIERATVKFETAFTTTASKSIESLLLPVEDEILRISNMKSDQHQIPKSLEHYPLIKIYCLNIIDSLRWLQTTKNIISPISLCLDTYATLNGSLTRVMKALAIILNMDNNSNHPILSKIAISFITEALPFFMNYCELLFPEKVVLSAIGVTKSEFKAICTHEPEKLKNFRLNLGQIADPLKSTMPALLQTLQN